MKVNLTIDHYSSLEKLQELAPTIGDYGWYILQSYTKLTFESWTPGTIVPIGDEHSGTLFGANAELRWTRENDNVDFWHIRHTEGATHEMQERPYLGWGYWENNRFWEPEIDREVKYPVQGPFPRKARPQFLVYEYRKAKPVNFPTDSSELQNVLNQPTFEAYRLAGFTVKSAAQEPE